MNTLKTIELRLSKKTDSLTADEKKIENLNAQILQYQNSIERIDGGLDQKRSEVAVLKELQEEARVLERRDGKLASELEAIIAHYDQFEFRSGQPDEEKLEYSMDYKKKLAERQGVVERLTEIEKIANKTYYRR